ncbi:hypothetical protein D3C76_1675600 [compost metagenome]
MALAFLHTLLRANYFAFSLPGQIVLRQFQQETAGFRPHQLTVLATFATQGENQLLLGAGDPHIGQTPFFIDIILVNTALMRQ